LVRLLVFLITILNWYHNWYCKLQFSAPAHTTVIPRTGAEHVLRMATHCTITQPCKHKVITQPSSKNIAHATFAARGAF
jgi:hypothetical protein